MASPQLTAVTVTIPAGESLSGPVDATAQSRGILRIAMPPVWTSAWLSFQISDDGVAYSDLYWPNSNLVVVTVVPGGTIITDSSLWQSAFFRLRSGSSLSPIVQPQARDFKCYLETTSLMVESRPTSRPT